MVNTVQTTCDRALSDPVATPIRVIVADEDALRREGLQILINLTPNMTCSAACASSTTSLRAMAHTPCDVLVMHIKLGGPSCFTVIKELAMRPIPCKILVIVDCVAEHCPILARKPISDDNLASFVNKLPSGGPDDCLQIALKLGASGVVRNPSGFAELAQAIEAVFAGKFIIEYPVAARLAVQYLISLQARQVKPDDGTPTLTLRERQVLALISQGTSNKDISREMQISYSTVKNYVSNLLRKLNLSDRTQLAIYAVESTSGDAR